MQWGRTEKTEDVVKKGDRVQVKLIERDERGRLRLSRKALLPKPEGMPEGGNGGGRDGGSSEGGEGGEPRSEGGGDREGRGDRGGRGGRSGGGRGRPRERSREG